MHVVIVLLKAVLVLVAVPVLITIYLATAERLKEDKFWRRWIFNLPFLGLVLVSGGAVALEVWSYEQSTPSMETDRPLRFLPLETYEKELDNFQQKPQDWPIRKQELIRKFQFAEYAYSQRDYRKSVAAFSELENGQDALGPLFRIASFAVANDLACAYFRRQRDHGFFASRYLELAQSRAPLNSKDAQDITENIAILDDLVNRLD
jgi:hypothetical protein